MDSYNGYSRSSPEAAGVSRTSTRDRDEYRSADAYRDNRRRSPDRRRDRERRRSRSPAGIDRYQPDRVPRDDYRSSRDYEDSRRDRRRSSPERAHGNIDRYVPGQDPPQPALLINPLPDPMKLDFQVGFTWFAEWWRTEQRIKDEKERAKTGRSQPRIKGDRETREDREAERPKIQAAYDQYKENLQKQQAQTFVRMHKNEDWFRERYVPEVKDPFRARLMEYRKGLFAQWENELTGGLFDEFTLEGIYKSESNGLGGILEKEEGETTAAAEVLGVGDLLPSRGGDIRDPVAQQPTLLIKTIAPTVTREKFEAFAKEHLGDGDGGFKHLSLSDPNPLKKCHRMGWIMLNSEPEQHEEDMTDARPEQDEGEEGEEGQADGASEKPRNLLTTSQRALDKINGKTIEDPERGNFTVHCGVHRPPDAPRKKALWDLFSAPERVRRDLELATRLVRKLDNELGDEIFGVAKIEERVHQLAEGGNLQPPVSSKAPKDLDAMDEVEEGEEEGMIEDEDETDDEDLLIRKKKLDLLVEYLRRVYNFCFFCVFESDSVHELQRKCPGGHLRRPRASLTSAAKETARASATGDPFPLKKNGSSKDPSKSGDTSTGAIVDDGDIDLNGPESPAEERSKFSKPSGRSAQQLQRAYNWVKTFEEKVLQILEPESVNIRKLGGSPLEEGVNEELIKFVKQEDASKYRCKVPECTKLFKGQDFWRKHVEKRHPEFYERLRSDIELVNTYVLDPAHIAPSRSDANSNGHFPLGNSGMPTGTPRGFSLQSHFQTGFPAAAGMAPQGFPAAPGLFAPGALPPGWATAGSPMGQLPVTMAGVGPMRSGRNFMNGYRNTGPYARPDGRGNRAPSFSGRSGVGPSVEGGLLAMGPREATQGRIVRSYEDLDATGPEGKEAELDY